MHLIQIPDTAVKSVKHDARGTKEFHCFIDLKKAFDTVNRNALLHKIFQYNIRGNFFSVLESMYKKVSFSVDLPQYLDVLSGEIEKNLYKICILHVYI